MPRIVKCGLIQTSLAADVKEDIEKIRDAQVERTLKYIDQAGQEGVQMLCMQEIFTGPYFCAEQSTRWYDAVEHIPDGPTSKLMQEYAKKYNMVIVVPRYEEEGAGVHYNPATVAGLSEYLWRLEQPAHAVANGYFVGAINRVGFEAPWNIGEFYGQSYFCDPRGQILSIAKRDENALVTAELDLDKIREVRHT